MFAFYLHGDSFADNGGPRLCTIAHQPKYGFECLQLLRLKPFSPPVVQLCTDFLLPIVNSPLIRRGLNRTLGGTLNKSLRRYLTSLLLFFVFAAVRTGYGQTTDYAALRSAGRVEHWAGHFDSDLVDAQVLSNLGAIFQRQHKYGKAEESYKRSLEITEQQLGLFHPYLTLTLGNLGCLYTEMGRHSQVEGQYRRSVTILDQMSPAPNGRIVLTLHWLGKSYLQQGEKSNAEDIPKQH
ncbi:MAG: hypothetical protein AUI54_00650 [Acidobacteria bacterium 13_1_40CM_2_56_5]|nr:MAG: hypothetical protein AUI54_00650 [Acidobacteria bacterium 13_1_40CM_2_56_5]